MDQVAVVILNYNGKKFLEKFLPGVIQHSKGHQVVVADNGSTDDSLHFLYNYFPDVLVISIGKNEGFCEGYNIALQQVEAKYYVLLNSDVEVSNGWIEPVLELMDGNPNIGACQPKIRSYYERQNFEYAGAAGGWLDKWGYPFCRGRIFDVVEQDRGQYNDISEIFWATGACMFVRSDVYHQLGGLDKDFFAHMEEIDLCWRMKNTGYQVYYCGMSEVYHVGGGTLPKSNSRKTYLNFRNGLALLYKNLPSHRWARVLLIRLLLDGVAAFRFLLSGQVANFTAVLKAHFAFYFSIPALHKKRANVPRNSHKGIYMDSIVIAHFIRGVKTFPELLIKIPIQ